MTQHQSQKSKSKTKKRSHQRELAGEKEKRVSNLEEDVTDSQKIFYREQTIDTHNKTEIDASIQLQQQEIQKPGEKLSDNPTNTVSSSNIANQKDLHPFVYWAQSGTHISLRIDLLQVVNLKVDIVDSGEKLVFSAKGKGAHGLQSYFFTLDFHSQVDEKFDCHTIERYVLLLIKKVKQPSRWPRLIKQQAKLPWLRFDFDRYTGDDSDDSNNNYNNSDDEELDKGRQSYELLKQQLKEAKQQQEKETPSADREGESDSWTNRVDNIFKNNIKNNTNFDIFNPFNKQSRSNSKNNKNSEISTSTGNMKFDYRKDGVTVDNSRNTAKQLDYKKTYLFLYNLMMFIMFLKVNIVLIIKLSNKTIDDEILQGAAFIVRMLTYTQLMETIHPILGLVPGGPLMPFTQVIGRLLVNYFLTDTDIRLNSAPYAHYLFIVWSSIEIFRYPLYALKVFNVRVYPLTWCRYTLFLPLYPMGGFFESMIILSTISRYEKSGEFSLSLPNQANVSFSLPIFLKIYTYLLLGPTIYMLMKYMWKQRSKQLKQKED